MFIKQPTVLILYFASLLLQKLPWCNIWTRLHLVIVISMSYWILADSGQKLRTLNPDLWDCQWTQQVKLKVVIALHTQIIVISVQCKNKPEIRSDVMREMERKRETDICKLPGKVTGFTLFLKNSVGIQRMSLDRFEDTQILFSHKQIPVNWVS